MRFRVSQNRPPCRSEDIGWIALKGKPAATKQPSQPKTSFFVKVFS
jgi:hypothetical protein